MSIKFFLHNETQKREVFQDDFLQENIPTLERSQESDCTCQGTKISLHWRPAGRNFEAPKNMGGGGVFVFKFWGLKGS